jgi:flagellar biosynthesis/type III secretory pathway protein FliH
LIPRARVVRGGEAARATPLFAPGPGAAQRRRIAHEELEARLHAERMLQEAREEAAAVVARGADEGRAVADEAVRQARVEADAQLAARWMALRAAEGRRLDDDAERIVPVAVALAERLVGATLELQPDRIARLAAVVLAEARGARRAVVEAHPADAEALRALVGAGAAGLDAHALDVRNNESLARGALRLHTDVGTIDAQLAPRLERLADALRDALR